MSIHCGTGIWWEGSQMLELHKKLGTFLSLLMYSDQKFSLQGKPISPRLTIFKGADRDNVSLVLLFLEESGMVSLCLYLLLPLLARIKVSL